MDQPAEIILCFKYSEEFFLEINIIKKKIK